MKKKTNPTQCETCVYFDVIDEVGTEGCTVNIDADDM